MDAQKKLVKVQFDLVIIIIILNLRRVHYDEQPCFASGQLDILGLSVVG